MGTFTATILVGHAHQNHSGIIPTHFILLSENSRPALILKDLNDMESELVIIPTVENMVDDIYLMIAVYILKIVNPLKELHNQKRDSLYDIFKDAERKLLYEETLLALQDISMKVVFNILEESSLLGQFELIKKYPTDFEVTTTTMKKEYNAWSGSVQTKGF